MVINLDMNGKTFKDRAYTKSNASVRSSTKPVGVLGSWFLWNEKGELESEHVNNITKLQTFLPIELYHGHVRQPLYVKQILKISVDLVKKLNEMNDDIMSD